MARARQKHKILDDIGNFMLSSGKLMDQREYSDAKNTPIRYPQILSFFGSWNRMMNSLNVHCPNLCTEIEKAEKAPKVAPKPKTVEKPKPAPVKAAPQPKATSTVKKEEK
jgi:hypothetical protein